MQATPHVWHAVVNAGWRRGNDRFKALVGGDIFNPDLAHALLTEGCDVYNLYGPTEATIWATYHKIERVHGQIPIGRPLPGVQVYVLDPEQRRRPPGAEGELYLGGRGVARGYRGRADLTSASFMSNPFTKTPAQRMYRTGDLVRDDGDGVLNFLGRRDRQIKIKGARVELGEIETVLRSHPKVRDAIVVQHLLSSGQIRLVACVVLNEDLTDDELRTFAADHLPDYMIPTLRFSSQLPLMPSGKPDVNRILETKLDEAGTDGSDVGEEILIGIWQDLLGVPVSPNDNFFELGGDSLTAQLVVMRAEQAGMNITRWQLRQHPTPRRLAAAAGQRGNTSF